MVSAWDNIVWNDERLWQRLVVPAVLNRDNHQCVKCKSTRYLVVHHKRYGVDALDCTINDLEVLCRSCHKKEHNRLNKKK